MRSRRRPIALLALAAALAASACLGPRLEGRKLVGDEQEAIPYYLPKPHLLVSRNFTAIQSGGKTATLGKDDSGRSVFAYQIVYLPDRCNRYGLKVSPGIGTLEAEIQLEDGWKFTGTKLAIDTRTPETIGAIGGLGELGKAFVREGAPADAEVSLYDLFTGQCVFAWPSRDGCAPPTACPAPE